MTLIESLMCIERIDQLIRLKAIGSPKQLAKKIEISERTVHRLIDKMKKMDAPIYYCNSRQSYCYNQDVEFRFGFYVKSSQSEELNGGNGNSFNFFLGLPNFGSPKNYFCIRTITRASAETLIKISRL